MCVCVYVSVCPWKLLCLFRINSLRLLFSRSDMSDSLRSRRLQYAGHPSPSPTPRACSNSCPLMPPNHLTLCHPLLLLSSIFPSIRVFSNESALHIWWPKYWSFSFSISFQRIFRTDFLQDWLVWSPCNPRDFQGSFPTPQFKSINSSVLSFLYSPTLTSIHDYWTNHSFDSVDLCQPSDVSAFKYAI